mmetsp:Transcript_13338/g.21881  ORF Transcript_13338/g.21881 Transcript_13338/m.21881 type:complete len:96 (-) Transcript_13338:129-416(-)
MLERHVSRLEGKGLEPIPLSELDDLLQTISVSRDSVLREKAQRSARLCIVCMEKECAFAFLPCGHYVLCEKCSNDCKTSCPKCRAVVQERVRIYL